MKYTINHSENFIIVGPPFFVGFFDFFINIGIEFNVMLILSTTEDIMGVLLKFVSLSAINRIPGLFFNSINYHKATGFGGLKVPIMNFRKNNPLKGAHWTLHAMRFVYKLLRISFCSIGFYFMPYIAILVNF
jgi:hypothetical protein